MLTRNKNPKGSNVYNTGTNEEHTTPSGSYVPASWGHINISILADWFSWNDELKKAVK
jgi:hypothetical protein